jgi:hypothetical protein
MELAAALPTTIPTRFRRAGWLLTAQALCWPAVIATVIASFPPSEFATWTPAMLADVRVPWILLQIFLGLAYLLGGGGLIAATAAERTGPARLPALGTLICAAGAIALVLLISTLRFTVLGFDAATLGDVRAYQISDRLYVFADGLALLATVLGAITLWQCGLVRWAALVVALLGGLLFVGLFFTSFPPFVLGVLWLILGIAILLWRHSV